ncbi:MAG: AMP-binding protein [Bacteroidetes bacterium]|nr:AMP-binding protein [Bacteroidota bacterium]
MKYPTTYRRHCIITFTTGSTGIPKAAKRTLGFLKAQFDVLLPETQTRDQEIDMPVLPIVLLMNFGTGTTSVIADFNARKPDTLQPENVLKQLRKYQVTRIIASPFFIKQIAKHLISTKAKTPNLTRIITGGAPVFTAEATIYCEAFRCHNRNRLWFHRIRTHQLHSAFQLIKENNKIPSWTSCRTS